MVIRENVSLAELTTIGLGGEARYFVSGATVEELKEAWLFARENNLPVHVLGGGSNTIFADQGFAGLVIKVGLKGIRFKGEGLVLAAAGEEWDGVVKQCVERDLAGLECLSGVPGLVGAAPVQNLGAYGQQVASVIMEVEALDGQSLELVALANKQCQFGYRQSRFKKSGQGRYIITGVTFQLQPGGEPRLEYPELIKTAGRAPTLLGVRQAVLKLRRRKSMIVNSEDPHSRSCGSFFVNPLISRDDLARLQKDHQVPYFEVGDDVKVPAAWLVEQAGFSKGFRQGGVGISPHHALALVNYGGTAKDLLALAEKIQIAVKKKFGVELEREPVAVD